MKKRIIARLKKYLYHILQKSPGAFDLVMDVCTDIMLKRAEAKFLDILAEETAREMRLMIEKENTK